MDRTELEQIRYARSSAFSYTCHACRRCCHDKIIRLNPYEVARLAQNRGVSTTEFLAQYTGAQGTALKQVDQGACVFLTPEGCGVHADRPLVCRLYPLGRRVTAEGRETFHELLPNPETEGEYGLNGTVEEFLAGQGTAPFIDAVDRYVEVVGRMSAVLGARIQSDAGLDEQVRNAVSGVLAGDAQDGSDWIDMDAVVEEYCRRQGTTVPPDVPTKMAIHIQAIEERLQNQ
jgi:hypothetical protein